jgi:hypothetical protein
VAPSPVTVALALRPFPSLSDILEDTEKRSPRFHAWLCSQEMFLGQTAASASPPTRIAWCCRATPISPAKLMRCA